MIVNNLSSIKDCRFFINHLAAFEKSVQPPVPFVCSTGDLLFERLFYVVHGKIIFDIDGDTREFAAGSILYLPYDVTYKSRWSTDEEGRYISIQFIMQSADNEIILLSDKLELFFHDDSKKYYRLFKSMSDTWATSGAGHKLQNYSQFYNILFELYNDKERMELHSDYHRIYKSVLYLENNYLRDISTDELSKMSCLKECMYRRIFKQIKGISPIQYRNKLRLAKAHEMLSTGRFSVIEAMIASGFNDMSYFYKLFKREYSAAPSDLIPRTPSRLRNESEGV